MKVYLGGPINGCSDAEANGWRDIAKTTLAELGHEWIDPMTRDYRGREMEPGIAQAIVEGDIDDINESDLLLMSCPKPSVGTSMEIFYGHSIGKRVVVILPDDGREPSPWLVVHSDKILRCPTAEAVRSL